MAKIENSIECIDILMNKMTEKGFDELEFSCEEFELKLVKNRPAAISAMPAPTAVAVAAAPSAASAAPEEKTGNIVTSPIVGTFYSSPSPDKPSFVTTGKKVAKGDTIMIIESMKLMNEIQSDFSGTVDEIFVKNGDAVEFGQPIMRIV